MKRLDLNIGKEWLAKRAAAEGDHEIGAGHQHLSTIKLTPDQLAIYERLAFEALPQWAQRELADLRAKVSASAARPPTDKRWKDISTAPKDKTLIIIAVPTKDEDGHIVGEAYFDPKNYGEGDWWWAGTAAGDYFSGPISDINHHGPTHWQPLPEPPLGMLAME